MECMTACFPGDLRGAVQGPRIKAASQGGQEKTYQHFGEAEKPPRIIFEKHGEAFKTAVVLYGR